MKEVLVWDIPTRVFHWALVVSFAIAFLTSEGDEWRYVHLLFGYSFLGLIAFRLLWGFVGSRYARFASFLYSPQAITSYFKSLSSPHPQHVTGHNPVGSLAIFAMLLLGIVIGITGLFAQGERGGESMEELHEAFAYIMLAVVGLHIVGAVVSSYLHKENLPKAMITGRKLGEEGEGIAHQYLGLALLMVAVLVILWGGGWVLQNKFAKPAVERLQGAAVQPQPEGARK